MSTTDRYISIFIVLFFMVVSSSLADIGLSPKWFAEIYDETINFQRDGDNTISCAHAIEGIKLQFPAYVKTLDIYLKQRYGSDANRDYWNNRSEIMAGARIRFFSKIYVALFYEYIHGWDMGKANSKNPNPYDRNYEDMRYGFIFWQGMDVESKHAWKKNFPLSFWDEIYADAILYKSNDNNFISYTNLRTGARLARLYQSILDIYFALYYGIDSNKDFWNNKYEFGLGFRIKPWTELDLSLFIEFLNGYYIERNGRYPNPYKSFYQDKRFGILFWHGLGF